MQSVKRIDRQFSEIVKMIHEARFNAIKSVNAELVKLYWDIGEYISKKLASAEWGDSVVDSLADFIRDHYPEFKGFTRRGLYRMRQFYETYRQKLFVSAVLTQTGRSESRMKIQALESSSVNPKMMKWWRSP